MSQDLPLSQDSFSRIWNLIEEADNIGAATNGEQQYTNIASRLTDYAYSSDQNDQIASTSTIEVMRYSLPTQDTIAELFSGSGLDQIPTTVLTDESLELPTSSIDLHQNIQIEPPSSDDHQAANDVGPSSVGPSIPSNTEYHGEYEFQLGFENPKKETKSANWTYSKDLKKLYVSLFKSCPIKYKTITAPPAGSLIRAMPIFMKPEYVQEPVTRCVNHAQGKETNENHEAPTHLVRCEHKLAQYHTAPLTERESVVIPYESPHVGSDWVTNLYQFMCYSSCSGGLNRRNVQVIFTLEARTGEVLGRSTVEVRICACPGRDRRAEERDPTAKPTTGTKRGAKVMLGAELVSVGPGKKKRDDELFTLQIHGRDNYEHLCKIRDCLELAHFLPQNVIDDFKAKRGQLNTQPTLIRVPLTSSGPSTTSQSSVIPTFTPTSTPPTKPTNRTDSENVISSSQPFEVKDEDTTITPTDDSTVAGFLKRIGMMAYTDMFHRSDYKYMFQLEDFSIQDLDKMRIGSSHSNQIWKELLDYRGSGSNLSTQEYGRLPQSQSGISQSSGSTLSAGSLSQPTPTQGPATYEVTRFTFKHTISMPQNQNSQEHDYVKASEKKKKT